METKTTHTVSALVQAKKIGGARPGAGRKPGVTAKITASQLLAAVQDKVGMPLAEALAEGYLESIQSGNGKLRLEYERLLLAKTVADKIDVTVVETAEQVEQRRQAFQTAIQSLTVR
jgi:hypothetical protein